MLKFQVFNDGRPAEHLRLRNAMLVGADHSPVRADLWFAEGMVHCQKRETGAAALALQWPAGECGELTLQTCLLPERSEPYLLTLELARHRIMLIYTKLEEWGMFELVEEHPVSRRVARARRLFVEALCEAGGDPVRADRVAGECLAAAIDASEELALSHAEMLLSRRRALGLLPKGPVGCGVVPEVVQERVRAGVVNNFDFIALPLPWKRLAPAEGEYQWERTDDWVEWAGRARVPLIVGPVVSFDPTALPDWVYMWEHDYETVRDLLYEHTERVVNRYRASVNTWIVVSGLHVNSHFPFSFDQLMEISRMCAMLVKKLLPAGRVFVELRQPFGEYFASNPRSIPPLMYADLLVQNAVAFDGFALSLLMGQAVSGQYVRDLMQLGHVLDIYGSFGKPLHVSLGVPSEPVTELMIAAPGQGEPVDPNCGYWRKPFSQLVQGRWAEAMLHLTLARPFVESVAWHEIVDHAGAELPLAGLMDEALQPKAAFRRLVAFRRGLQRPGETPADPGLAAPTAPPSKPGG